MLFLNLYASTIHFFLFISIKTPLLPRKMSSIPQPSKIPAAPCKEIPSAAKQRDPIKDEFF